MHKRKSFLLISILFISISGISQPPIRKPDGGGNYTDLIQVSDEMSPEQRAAIIQMLKTNETRLRSEGKLVTSLNPTVTGFEWPIKQAPGYNDNGYYGISNYVDENPAFPNAILDYNCGSRTYDLSSGYNHKGTDIFTWPFAWQKMSRNIVQIIAAAPGTIIGKTDGNFDQNCAMCSGPGCNWNSVYVMQADGSVAWYGHMKSGSLTSKLVGQTVALGEYLGVIGSSGSSTAPHLHFEVYTNSSYTQLVDPWAGPCNNMNGLTSWWANQQPYRVSTLNKVMTHSAAPGAGGNCPGAEAPNEKINFANGQVLYLGSYYRDQLSGHQSIHYLYKPDNTLYLSWTQNFTASYNASWWWYSRTLPNPATTGTWKYEIVYNGTQTQATYFAVNSSYVVICPENYNILTSNITGSTYQWQVNTGSGFTDISDNVNYSSTATQKVQLINVPSSFYDYQYRCYVNSTSYSDVISLKFISYWNGSVSNAWEDPANWSCGNIPDANTDVVIKPSSNTPEVGSLANCRSVSLLSGAVFTVKAGYNLNILH